jgi:hypothetical protein
VVRSFGGWELPGDLCAGPDFAASGYARGVPMGGELAGLPHGPGAAPAFAVRALQDPGTPEAPGAPLQRAQIVKIWLEDGGVQERVVDVAGDPHNGARVDTATCTPRGDGFARLCGVWRDPDFDADQAALYYARVVENPTCRWSTFACNARGVDCRDPSSHPGSLAACCDPEVPRTIQERAWTSPIWYTPPR